MTYSEANDLIDEEDKGFNKAWDLFKPELSEDAVSICKKCEHDQSCRMTEIIDYSDSTIVNCNFYLDSEASKKSRQGD